ncbi:hypothetical protein D3C76_1098150 [compost metagenome]
MVYPVPGNARMFYRLHAFSQHNPRPDFYQVSAFIQPERSLRNDRFDGFFCETVEKLVRRVSESRACRDRVVTRCVVAVDIRPAFVSSVSSAIYGSFRCLSAVLVHFPTHKIRLHLFYCWCVVRPPSTICVRDR